MNTDIGNNDQLLMTIRVYLAKRAVSYI